VKPARLPSLVVAASLIILVIAVLVAGLGGGPASPPLPGAGRAPRPGDPFSYQSSRAGQFTARATAGSAHVLFAKSPGGAIATAGRVAAFRPLIVAATRGTGIDPNILEGIVFVESAGRPEVIAGSDPSAAAGLTQILAQTGQALLGMHVDLSRSRRLTKAITRASARGDAGAVKRLERQRAGADDRFNPRRALAATVRYLKLAGRRFGRADLAVVSYHMGIGNLGSVLERYDGGRAVPYAQLFFDTAPARHPEAYRLIAGFGDESRLYYWRVLAAVQIMSLYRTDLGALRRLDALQTASGSSSEVLHPPDQTQSFAGPESLSAAYANRTLRPLPANAAQLGLAYDPSMGAMARRVGAPSALYRGLRPAALDLLIELGARVRALSGGSSPLTLTSTVTDRRYQRALGVSDPDAVTGFAFQVARRYAGKPQAEAFQAMLDRLQALNLIAWERTPDTIKITVAADASQVIVNGV